MFATDEPMGYRTSVELVTPELAKLFLESQGRNRNPSLTTVKYYAQTMLAGEWVLTPQGLIFDQQDRLIDGQHRLLAVIESGCSISFHCSWGVPQELMMIIDQGLLRRAYQAATIQGLSATNNDLSVLRVFLTRFDRQSCENMPGVRETLRLFETYKDALYFANKEYRACNSQPVKTAPCRAAVARAFYTQDHERLQQFLYVLDTGLPSELSEDGAAILLRNIATSNKSGSNAERMRLYRLSITALASFLKKKKLYRLSEAEKNPFYVDGLPD